MTSPEVEAKEISPPRPELPSSEDNGKGLKREGVDDTKIVDDNDHTFSFVLISPEVDEIEISPPRLELPKSEDEFTRREDKDESKGR